MFHIQSEVKIVSLIIPSQLDFMYINYKVWVIKNGTDVWPYNSKPINSTAKLLFIRSKGIVLRIKMRYGRSL